jgi:hypothetical protein
VLHCRATLDGLGVRRVDFFVATFAFRAYWTRHGAHSTFLSHWTRHEASLSSFAILDFLVTRHEAYCDLGHIGLGTRHIGLLVPYWTRHEADWTSRAVRAILDSARGRLDISCVPYWTRHEADWTCRACHIGLGTRHIGLLVPHWTRHEADWTSRACHIGLGTRHI